MKSEYVTIVKVLVLWQGMHDSVTRVFPGRLSIGEIAKLIDKEAVSFKFKIKQGRKIVRPFGRTYFLGGRPIKGEGKIVTRYDSHTFFHKGDVVLRGF